MTVVTFARPAVCLLVVSLVGLLLAFSEAGRAANPDDLTATLVDIATDSTDPNNLADTEPSIAVNPLDPRQIAVVTFSDAWDPNNPAIMAPVWKSNDGGVTWRKVRQIPRPLAGLFGPGDQKITFNREGRLFVAELGLGGDKPDFIYRQTSGNADDPLVPGTGYGDDQPHLEIDKSSASPRPGHLYSPWLMTTVGNYRSMVSVSDDGGVAMTDIPVGDNSTFPNRTTRIALAADGTAYIVYKTREGNAGSDFENAHFWVRRSTDGGQNWSPRVSVHGISAVQTFFTINFGNPSKGKVARARSSDAWIAVDPYTGDVYVAYVSKDSSGFAQIYAAYSDDQGASWTSYRVTDGTHHSAYPEIAIADDGTVGALYIDYDDSGTSTCFRHHFARAFLGLGTWRDQILQTMDPGPLQNAASGFLWGDYEGLTAQGNSFYGVFTGQSIGRTVPQLDPIFFKESALVVEHRHTIERILTSKQVWAQHFPIALARVPAFGSLRQREVEVFPNQMVGASPLKGGGRSRDEEACRGVESQTPRPEAAFC